MANNLPWFLSRFGPTTKYLLYVLIQQPFPRLQIHPPSSSSSSLICPSSTSSRRGGRRRRNKPSFCTISSLPQCVCCCSCAPNLGSHQSRRIEWGMLWFDESLFLIYLQITFHSQSDPIPSLWKYTYPKSTSQSKGTRLENMYNTCGGHQRPWRRRRRYYYYDNVNKIKERALFLSIVCGLPRSCLCNDGGHKINV